MGGSMVRWQLLVGERNVSELVNIEGRLDRDDPKVGPMLVAEPNPFG